MQRTNGYRGKTGQRPWQNEAGKWCLAYAIAATPLVGVKYPHADVVRIGQAMPLPVQNAVVLQAVW